MTYDEYASLRDGKGVCDAEVARAIDINRSTFAQWKSGRAKPKQDKIEKLEEYFGLEKGQKVINFDTKAIADALSRLSGGDPGIIDVESQLYLRNDMLHRLLLAGGKVFEEDPKVIEAMVYTLEKMGDKK